MGWSSSKRRSEQASFTERLSQFTIPLRAIVLLAAVRWTLPRSGFRAANDLVERLCPARKDSSLRPPDDRTIRRVQRATTLATRLVWHATTCLPTSIVLNALLRRERVDSSLRIGVRVDGPDLAAHAWVEVAGQPVNDSPEAVSEFAVFEQPVTPAVLAAMR